MSATVPFRPDPHAKTAATFDRAYTLRVMAIASVLVMIVMYVEGMLTPSLPTIQTDFGVGISEASLILSVYLVTGVALSPIAGKLGDVYGKKRVLSVVLGIYAVAVSVTGFSPTFEFMVASRAVQGVGLTVFPLVLSLVREEFPREMVPRAQGILSGLFGAGFAVSLPLGAFVSNAYGWRFTYHSAIPVVVGITIAALVLLRESPYRRPEAFIDYAGAGTLAVSLGLVVLGLSQGPSWGWSSVRVLLLLGVGAGLLLPIAAIELYHHRRGREVILDVPLLRRRNVLVANAIVLVSGLGMFLAFQALTYRFREPTPVGFGYDIFHTGLSFVAFAVPMLIFAPLASVFISRFGAKPLTIVGCAVGAVGFYLGSLADTVPAMLEAMIVIGAGLAVMNSSVINLLVLTVEPREMGLATSLNAVFRNVGSSLGAPIAGTLLSTYTIAGGTLPGPTAFRDSFLIAAVAAIVAAAIVVFAKEILGRRAVREELASDEREPLVNGRTAPAGPLGPAADP